MRALLFLAFVGFSYAYVRSRKTVITDEFINEINNKQSLWTAGKNINDNRSFEDFRKLLGVVKKSRAGFERKRFDVKINLPESFDSRDQWPNCSSIKEIADQSACCSGWAVAAASSMSDRLCIKSDGNNQLRVSANNLIACFNPGISGCTTCEFSLHAWAYWQTDGIVTGGLYNTSDGCQPYPFPPCGHYKTAGNYPACPSDMYDTPSCEASCSTSAGYKDSLTWGKNAYPLEGEEDIQQEILTNGPTVLSFDIYEDFTAYKSGIYRYTSGDFLGVHFVRAIGWGVENNVKYWLIANSWNPYWGEQGLFRIIRGENDCASEQEASAGEPKL